MGYRHYVGYIEKSKYDELVKKADTLEGYEKTSFMRDNATEILELGKLYWKNTEDIYNLLYENKTVDFSNDDTEFFVIDDNKILLRLSYAMQKIWIKYIGEFKPALDKILSKSKKELTDEEKLSLKELRSQIDEEERYLKTAIKNESGSWDFPPYNNWQWNYEACRVYNLHQKFDYSDKIIVVYAY